MPEITLATPARLGSTTLQAIGTNEISDTITVNTDAAIQAIDVEIPNGCTLVVTRQLATDAATVEHINVTAGVGGLSATEAVGLPLASTTRGGVISVTTSGAANGQKRVTVSVLPVATK